MKKTIKKSLVAPLLAMSAFAAAETKVDFTQYKSSTIIRRIEKHGKNMNFMTNDYVLSNTSGTIFFKLANYDTNTSPNGFNKILVFQEVSSSSLDNSIYFEEYNGENTILLKKGGTTL